MWHKAVKITQLNPGRCPSITTAFCNFAAADHFRCVLWNNIKDDLLVLHCIQCKPLKSNQPTSTTTTIWIWSVVFFLQIIAMARLRNAFSWSYLGNSYWGMIKLAKHMIFNAQVKMLATRVIFGWAPAIPPKQCNEEWFEFPNPNVAGSDGV